jgi:cell division protein ZapA
MRSLSEGVSVTILGKEFMVACPADERQSLIEAAKLLDFKMRDIQASGKVIGTERTAVIAALNLAAELLALQRRGGMPDQFSERLRSLQDRIETALAQ